jgi:DNA topoisomerase-1
LEKIATVPLEELKDPVASAEAAGLRYVSDEQPGIRRKRAGRYFSYAGRDGQPIKDAATLKRIKALAIPPAWTDVWICPHPRGHIQATGRDAKGRKQYRYHAEYRQVRDAVKYDRLIAFAEALPAIRRRVQEDLGQPGVTRERVLATVVKLLEETHIRVGNDEYRKQNRSFGLTTLQDRHVDVQGARIQFHFNGKSGIKHEVEVADRRLARIVKRCQDLPGQHLFQYLDENGERRDVDSDDVNEYLREISGGDFTAKDFRTWAGTVLAARFFRDCEPCTSTREGRQQVVRTIEQVAARLGNTVAVCRKCYVHPAIIDAYLQGTVIPADRDAADVRPDAPDHGLSAEERATLRFLKEQAGAASKDAPAERRAA